MHSRNFFLAKSLKNNYCLLYSKEPLEVWVFYEFVIKWFEHQILLLRPTLFMNERQNEKKSTHKKIHLFFYREQKNLRVIYRKILYEIVKKIENLKKLLIEKKI